MEVDEGGGWVWLRVLKGGGSQFWASRWGVAEGKEMVSARVGLEVRRLAAGDAGVRKEWVRWSRMWPSRYVVIGACFLPAFGRVADGDVDVELGLRMFTVDWGC